MTQGKQKETSTDPFLISLLVISDRAHAGLRPDQCRDAIARFLKEKGHRLHSMELVPDQIDLIQKTLLNWAAANRPLLALTAGGTGVSPRDVTPEATRPILEREIPGIPEAMRAASMKITSFAALSRGYAGFIGPMLVVNLPGSPKAAVENLAAVFDALEHAMIKAIGDMGDCVPKPAI
ncbi:MAG: MogA/MoaB family molybdenum cofactor biosynthesis protein [Nitrospinota bacterium]|nr:MogA/MoaB family molybdenum cofactor biosynthesis protein [Nitrospinota bacterium]